MDHGNSRRTALSYCYYYLLTRTSVCASNNTIILNIVPCKGSMVSMNSSKLGCNCPKLGCIKSAIFVDLSEKIAQQIKFF